MKISTHTPYIHIVEATATLFGGIWLKATAQANNTCKRVSLKQLGKIHTQYLPLIRPKNGVSIADYRDSCASIPAHYPSHTSQTTKRLPAKHVLLTHKYGSAQLFALDDRSVHFM